MISEHQRSSGSSGLKPLTSQRANSDCGRRPIFARLRESLINYKRKASLEIKSRAGEARRLTLMIYPSILTPPREMGSVGTCFLARILDCCKALSFLRSSRSFVRSSYGFPVDGSLGSISMSRKRSYCLCAYLHCFSADFFTDAREHPSSEAFLSYSVCSSRSSVSSSFLIVDGPMMALLVRSRYFAATPARVGFRFASSNTRSFSSACSRFSKPFTDASRQAKSSLSVQGLSSLRRSRSRGKLFTVP